MILSTSELVSRWAEVFGASALPFSSEPKPSAVESFSGIVTDSRQASAGKCFFALKGETQDGHAFVEAAIQHGAAGVVVQEDWPLAAATRERYPNLWVAEVPDTAQAFREATRLWRQAFHGTVLLIAGSVGKTTTKEWLAHILRDSFEILKTQGSQNGVLGIPATLARLEAKHQIALIEVGIDAPDLMAEHVALVQPTHALLTAIGPEHLEKLIDVPTVAHEELQAFSSASLETLYFQLEDEWIAKARNQSFAATHSHVRRRSVSLSNVLGATLQGAWNGTQLELIWPESSLTLTATLPLPGRAMAQNAALVALVAQDLGTDLRSIQSGLETFAAAPGRMEIRQRSQQTWFCDTYNSQPPSAAAALDMLAGISETDRILCLGDMLELGPGELNFHEALAPRIEACRARAILLLGPRMNALYKVLKQHDNPVEHFTSTDDLSNRLSDLLKPTTAILLKGSRGMRMERIWMPFFEPQESIGP